MKIDLTVLAIPAYVGAMAAEYLWQRRHPVPAGTRAGDYQLADTLASLSMGAGQPGRAVRRQDAARPRHARGRAGSPRSLIGRGRRGRPGDHRRGRARGAAREGGLPDAGTVPARVREVQDELAELRFAPARAARDATPREAATRQGPRSAGGERGGLHRPDGGHDLGRADQRQADVRPQPAATSGTGRLAVDGRAILGWDFLYYWNHRFSHESRWLWAVHVAHHSSERYNLSTALRQPVAEGVHARRAVRRAGAARRPAAR